MAVRTYRQHCGLAAALDLLGERWTMLVLRELSLGPKRFRDLDERLPGIGTNLLTARLRALEDAGVVHRTELPLPAGVRVYALTERGRRLEPILDELAVWGFDLLPDTPGDAVARGSWIALSMRAAAGGGPRPVADGVLALVVADEPFVLAVRGGHLHVRHGTPDAPADAHAETDVPTFYELAAGLLDVGAAEDDGRLTTDGDRDYLQAVLRAFPLPARADGARLAG